jgi:hypothetical protein
VVNGVISAAYGLPGDGEGDCLEVFGEEVVTARNVGDEGELRFQREAAGIDHLCI